MSVQTQSLSSHMSNAWATSRTSCAGMACVGLIGGVSGCRGGGVVVGLRGSYSSSDENVV